jgi:hypothetical protein
VEQFGYLSLAWTIVLIIYAIMLFMLPIFIWRIQKEVIHMRGQLTSIISLMRGQDPASEPRKTGIKTCPACNAPNRASDTICASCKRAI